MILEGTSISAEVSQTTPQISISLSQLSLLVLNGNAGRPL